MSLTLRKNAAAAGLLLVSALAIAGCSGGGASGGSSGGTSGSADVAAAQKVLDQATAKDNSFAFPTEKVAAPEGLSVVAIPCAYAAEGCKRTVDGIKDAAGVLGWQYKMIDPAGDPEKMREAIRTAVQLKVDAIFLAATPTDAVKNEVAAARAAGITVINTLEPAPSGFADGTVEVDRSLQGKWDAAFLTVKTGGKGKVVLINDPEFASIVQEYEGVSKGLKELCPGCTIVKDSSFQIANLQTQVPADFQATLTANPTVDAVWVAYDPIAAAIQPVIDRSDRTDSITIAGHNGDQFALEAIKKDKTSFKATSGFSDEWIAFAAVDQLLRVKAGSIVEDERKVIVPSKLLTKDNITNVPWLGDTDWRSQYLKLWGKG